MGGGKTFIITRPEADSARFIAAARAAGARALSAPLLSIVFDETVSVPERAYQAVAVTSANGARGVGAHSARERLIRAKALTVGPASSRAARAAGFAEILQAAGDVNALVEMTREKLSPEDGPVLYASGAITRGGLEGRLTAAGFSVDRVIFYEARAAAALPPEVRAFLASGGRGVVALYSPRSAKIWAKLVTDAGLQKPAGAQTCACLSQNVAEALRAGLPGVKDILVPSAPDEPSMLAMLGL